MKQLTTPVCLPSFIEDHMWPQRRTTLVGPARPFRKARVNSVWMSSLPCSLRPR